MRVVASRPTIGIPLGALAVLLTPAESADDGVAASAQVRDGIAAVAAGRLALVVVDDAQWLDEASAVVLHQLVAQGDITLLATLRTGEPAPEPVTALWKDGLVERIDVEPLGDEAVRDVLEAALGGPVETLTASRLWRRCAGNVLYLRELVREAERLGLVHQREGLWCIDTLPSGSRAWPSWSPYASTPSTNPRAPRSSRSRSASPYGWGCSTSWSNRTPWSDSIPAA